MSTCSARHPARYNTLLRHCFLGLLLGATLCGQAAPSATELETKPKKMSPEVAAQKRQANLEARKAMQERANQLRREAETERDSLKAKKASLEEAFILTKLVNGEDKNQKDRRRQLVARLVKDESVPKTKRFELAATSANAEVAVDRTLSHAQKMARFAEVAWQLTRDFPENADGYESLVFIARDSDSTQAREIIAKLLVSSAPEKTKTAASDLLQKLDSRSAQTSPSTAR